MIFARAAVVLTGLLRRLGWSNRPGWDPAQKSQAVAPWPAWSGGACRRAQSSLSAFREGRDRQGWVRGKAQANFGV